jgi:putative PIN family toxin of toxin-antitoxin system
LSNLLERSAATLRVVLDTNVLVSALLYQDGGLKWLHDAWKEGRVVPLTDQSVIDELRRILVPLGAKKFQLDESAVGEIVARYLGFTEAVPVDAEMDAPLPKCKDPDDQKFLELAQRGRSDVLVTSDGALLGLARRVSFRILSPPKFTQYALALEAR